MHAPNPLVPESRSPWLRRWPTWLALAAGTAVSLLAVFAAYLSADHVDGPYSDWLGLAFYLCGAVVTVTQALVLITVYRRRKAGREAS